MSERFTREDAQLLADLVSARLGERLGRMEERLDTLDEIAEHFHEHRDSPSILRRVAHIETVTLSLRAEWDQAKQSRQQEHTEVLRGKWAFAAAFLAFLSGLVMAIINYFRPVK
jgi:hypothetical protein